MPQPNDGSHPQQSSPHQLSFPGWEDWFIDTNEAESVAAEKISIEEQVTISKKIPDADTPKQLPLPGEFQELLAGDE